MLSKKKKKTQESSLFKVHSLHLHQFNQISLLSTFRPHRSLWKSHASFTDKPPHDQTFILREASMTVYKQSVVGVKITTSSWCRFWAYQPIDSRTLIRLTFVPQIQKFSQNCFRGNYIKQQEPSINRVRGLNIDFKLTSFHITFKFSHVIFSLSVITHLLPISSVQHQKRRWMMVFKRSYRTECGQWCRSFKIYYSSMIFEYVTFPAIPNLLLFKIYYEQVCAYGVVFFFLHWGWVIYIYFWTQICILSQHQQKNCTPQINDSPSFSNRLTHCSSICL